MTSPFINTRALRQRDHDEYTGGNMPRAPRQSAPIIQARRSDACPAGLACLKSRDIELGESITLNQAGSWVHVECRNVTPVRPISEDMTRLGRLADQADALLDEYDMLRATARQTGRRALPSGTYTVRPADESTAAVLSVGPADFGNFAAGTMKVSMHGSFSVLIDGLSQARSWYGFAIVRPDGTINVYKNARAIMETPNDRLRPEDVHVKTKLRQALKALRLLTVAGADELMSYGKAWAMANQACFRCSRPLVDEESQRDGIGPTCARKLREIVG